MKTRLRLFIAALSLSAWPLLPAAVQAGDAVVVELFTSQGCSACPAADTLVSKIADEDDLVVLSWAVNIWDYRGWEDTLSIPLSNERHSWYNKLDGSNMVYTPQVFIDGQSGYVGSRKRKVLRAIEQHRGDASVMVDIRFDTSDKNWVSLAYSQPLPDSADVRVVFFDDTKTVKIRDGENRGRTLTYTNIVRGALDLPRGADGLGHKVDLSTAYAKNCDAFAILVQDHETGKMLGAAVQRLKPKTT